MDTISRDTLETALDAADANWDYESTIRAYSGRGMYGAECAAIVLDDSRDVFAFFVGLAIEAGEELALEMARKVRQDSMGLGTVLYWPRLELVED